MNDALPQGSVGWVGAVGGWSAVLILLGLIVRQVIPWRKLSVDAEKDFRDGLVKRIDSLEQQLKTAAAEVRSEREKAEAERNAAAARLEAERALYRHRINNLDAAFNSLLLLLKKGVPVEEAVEAVERMRAEQAKTEAIEKSTLHATLLQNAGGGGTLE